MASAILYELDVVVPELLYIIFVVVSAQLRALSPTVNV
jgi:hypothetical protein